MTWNMLHFALLILQHIMMCDVLLLFIFCCCAAPLNVRASCFSPVSFTQAAIASAMPFAVENARPNFGKLGDTRKFATLSSIYVKMVGLLPISESRAAAQMSRRW